MRRTKRLEHHREEIDDPNVRTDKMRLRYSGKGDDRRDMDDLLIEARSHFKTSDDTTEAQKSHRATETSR